MPNIPFPNVPQSPGVPAIPRSPNFPTAVRAGIGLATSAILGIIDSKPRWGVFDSSGQPLGDPSIFTGIIGGIVSGVGLGSTISTNSVDYSKETRVSDFPIERGSFASYNKAEMPAEPVVTLCLSGTESNRREFLNAIDAACKSTDLYSVITPEVSYIEHSIERYRYERRNSKGAALIMVEISLREIRQVNALYTQVASKQIDQPQDPGATSQTDNGNVQATTPNQSTLKSMLNKFLSLIGF